MFVIASEARQSTADEQNNVLRKPLGLNDNAGDEPQFISWSGKPGQHTSKSMSPLRPIANYQPTPMRL